MLKPVAYVRRWAFDKIDVMAIPKKDRPRGWQFHEVTTIKIAPDDVALYALTPEQLANLAA